MKDNITIEKLVELLQDNDVRGVACSCKGDIVEFHNPGVLDLFNMLNTMPLFLNGGMVADRVVGRGAALLLVKGQVTKVYAKLISQPALNVLSQAGIEVGYDSVVPNIINRAGSGICPVEQLTLNVNDPDVAMVKIREFLTK